jgi:hypothetical protein
MMVKKTQGKFNYISEKKTTCSEGKKICGKTQSKCYVVEKLNSRV